MGPPPIGALPGTPIPEKLQRPGDAKAGYDALVNAGYVSCGIPWSAYNKIFGPSPPELRLPGRSGKNEAPDGHPSSRSKLVAGRLRVIKP